MIDHCAGCGAPLKPNPVGGRLYCCSPMYWSAARPSVADLAGKRKMTGAGIEEMKLRRGREQVQLYLYHPLHWLIKPMGYEEGKK